MPRLKNSTGPQPEWGGGVHLIKTIVPCYKFLKQKTHKQVIVYKSRLSGVVEGEEGGGGHQGSGYPGNRRWEVHGKWENGDEKIPKLAEVDK